MGAHKGRPPNSGTMKPGETRNPSGRPKLTEGWRAKLRSDPHLQELALALAKGLPISEVLERSAGVDREMLRYLLDQGFGRATQSLEHSGPAGKPMTVDHRVQIVADLKKLLDE